VTYDENNLIRDLIRETLLSEQAGAAGSGGIVHGGAIHEPASAIAPGSKAAVGALKAGDVGVVKNLLSPLYHTAEHGKKGEECPKVPVEVPIMASVPRDDTRRHVAVPTGKTRTVMRAPESCPAGILGATFTGTVGIVKALTKTAVGALAPFFQAFSWLGARGAQGVSRGYEVSLTGAERGGQAVAGAGRWTASAADSAYTRWLLGSGPVIPPGPILPESRSLSQMLIEAEETVAPRDMMADFVVDVRSDVGRLVSDYRSIQEQQTPQDLTQRIRDVFEAAGVDVSALPDIPSSDEILNMTASLEGEPSLEIPEITALEFKKDIEGYSVLNIREQASNVFTQILAELEDQASFLGGYSLRAYPEIFDEFNEIFSEARWNFYNA